MSPFVLLLYGPSGVGKTSLLRHLEATQRFETAKKFTTRPDRGTVDDGKDFVFFPDGNLPSGELAIFESYGHKFAIRLDAIDRSLQSGRNHAVVIGAADTARQLRHRFGAVVQCVLVWCDRETLRTRCFAGDSERAARWKFVEQEIDSIYGELSQMDWILDNSVTFEATVDRLDRLVHAIETAW